MTTNQLSELENQLIVLKVERANRELEIDVINTINIDYVIRDQITEKTKCREGNHNF